MRDMKKAEELASIPGSLPSPAPPSEEELTKEWGNWINIKPAFEWRSKMAVAFAQHVIQRYLSGPSQPSEETRPTELELFEQLIAAAENVVEVHAEKHPTSCVKRLAEVLVSIRERGVASPAEGPTLDVSPVVTYKNRFGVTAPDCTFGCDESQYDQRCTIHRLASGPKPSPREEGDSEPELLAGAADVEKRIEEAIDDLEDLLTNYIEDSKNGTMYWTKEGREKASAVLHRSLQPPLPQSWISVEERLPEPGVDVLLWLNDPDDEDYVGIAVRRGLAVGHLDTNVLGQIITRPLTGPREVKEQWPAWEVGDQESYHRASHWQPIFGADPPPPAKEKAGDKE